VKTWLVTCTYMLIDAETAERAIELAGDSNGGAHWEAEEVSVGPSGPLAEAVAQALEDRGNHAAAAAIRADEDTAWGQHIGPMLDAIEEEQ
jgi:hypothetical protein